MVVKLRPPPLQHGQDLVDDTPWGSVVSCGQWSVVVSGQLWSVVSCGQWSVVVSGLLWSVVSCGQWSVVVSGLLWSVVSCGQWSYVVSGQLWSVVSCGQWSVVVSGQLWSVIRRPPIRQRVSSLSLCYERQDKTAYRCIMIVIIN